MKIDIKDGDEKAQQYLILTPETESEEDFLIELRSFWKDQDR